MRGLPFRIRNFQYEDLESLCEIDRICFPDGVAFSRADLKFHINHPKSITRVGEGLGRILGFAIARMEHPPYAHVLTLDVVPDVRRCRVGLSLMGALHRALTKKDVEIVFLEVGVNNLPAQRLYEKLHYAYLETLYGYYQGTEDAYRMARTVKS
jgi:ribosomal protein S18 acetylase RimI-like enzyme